MMPKFSLPRRQKPRPYAEKFNPEGDFFGSREKHVSVAPDRRLLFLALAALGAVILCVAVLLVGRVPRIKAVVAEDGKLYTATVILSHAGIAAGDEYLGFDRSAVERNLREGMPLLDTVKVRRHLDGRVTIQVTELTSLYYTRHHVNYYIMDAKTLCVLSVHASPDEARRVGAVYIGIPEAARVRVGEMLTFVNLPYAPDSTPTEYTTYEVETKEPEKEYAYAFDFVDAVMAASFADRVKGMETGDRYDIYLVLEGRMKIRFGSMDELDRKLDLVIRTLEHRIDGPEELPTLIDVSDPARITTRRSPDVVIPDWGI